MKPEKTRVAAFKNKAKNRIETFSDYQITTRYLCQCISLAAPPTGPYQEGGA